MPNIQENMSNQNVKIHLREQISRKTNLIVCTANEYKQPSEIKSNVSTISTYYYYRYDDADHQTNNHQ